MELIDILIFSHICAFLLGIVVGYIFKENNKRNGG